MVTSKILILLVEDEVLIHNLLQEVLEEGGFDVIVASSAEDALKVIDDDGQYRALVTDVNLGSDKLDGWAIARHAREKIPELPIVYMTGDSAADWGAQGVPNSILITKPFAPAQIVTAVSQLLNAGSPPTT